MEQNPARRIRFSRRTVIIACVLLAAAGGAVTWRLADHAAALPHASCGETVTHGLYSNTQSLSADPGALHCFGSAARACRAAGIKVVEMGVDTGTDYVFTIGPDGSACQATEWSQYYSANFGGSRGPVTATSCRLSSVTGRGVMLRCDDQDVLIPATVSVIRTGTNSRYDPYLPPPPPSCGEFTTNNLGSATRVLSEDPGALYCFTSAAFGNCMAASITATETSGVSYVFTIEAPPEACEVTGQRRAHGRTTALSCRMTTGDSRSGIMLRCGRQDVFIPRM